MTIRSEIKDFMTHSHQFSLPPRPVKSHGAMGKQAHMDRCCVQRGSVSAEEPQAENPNLIRAALTNLLNLCP